MTVKTLSIITLGALLAAGVALASDDTAEREALYERRGPLPFEAYDLDGNGVVTAAEHAQVRSERQALRASRGYPMRGAGNAPAFEAIDRDGNGSIDRSELTSWHQQRMQQRFAGRMPRCAQ
ncbi:MAG: EF-hand domain-containing protein [Gammaproteobacteria bacterium]|nr:EF-hand domain-containing protein [Gammaproteobacteria bacterium]